MTSMCPGCMAQMVGARFCALEGCWLDSRSGHKQEATDPCFSLSLSFPLSRHSSKLWWLDPECGSQGRSLALPLLVPMAHWTNRDYCSSKSLWAANGLRKLFTNKLQLNVFIFSSFQEEEACHTMGGHQGQPGGRRSIGDIWLMVWETVPLTIKGLRVGLL